MKLLPQPSKDMDLKKFGYSTHKSKTARHISLKNASKKYGTLSVLKRLNLIRNLSRHGSPQKQIMSDDVEYMKKLYAIYKKKSSRKSLRKSSKKSSKSRNHA